jgi:hypothetical protein
VQAIVVLAHALGLEVVAEGVETATAARALLDLGCHRAQGLLLSRPLDSTATESLLAKRVIPMDFSTMGDSPPDDSSTSSNLATRDCEGLGERMCFTSTEMEPIVTSEIGPYSRGPIPPGIARELAAKYGDRHLTPDSLTG